MKKLFFILLISVTAFSSCEKNFTCTCSDSGSHDKVSTTTVTGKNANDASSSCLALETATTVCVLHE
ncbi:MAG: hypothetical protein WCI97_06560 [Bacteroidota bacterium]